MLTLCLRDMKCFLQVDHACLAIIAFSAGAELQLGDVRKIKKQACISSFIASIQVDFLLSWLSGIFAFLPVSHICCCGNR